MRYYIHKISTMDSYTDVLLRKLVRDNGHEISTAYQADFILVSICDVTQIFKLEKARKTYRGKKIVAGGHFALFFKLVGMFADYVVLGQGFEFFKCQKEEEIRALPCVYFKGKNPPYTPSTVIDWSSCPIVKKSKSTYNYFAGVGCKNKCQFCLTSWTNKQQSNYPGYIYQAIREAKKLGGNIRLIHNEYADFAQHQVKTSVLDQMAIDFIRVRSKIANRVRCGIEFATDETRRKYGKPLSDRHILRVFQVSKKYAIDLQLFFIAGLNTREEWIQFFDRIPMDTDFNPRVFIRMNNIDFQMFTPLFKKRFDLDPENLLDKDFMEMIRARGRPRGRLRYLPEIKYPSHSVLRTGLSLCTNLEQYFTLRRLKDEKSLEKLYRAVYESEIIKTDYSKEVLFWYNKQRSKK